MKTNMRRNVFFIIMVIAIIFSCVGCGGSGNDQNDNDNNNNNNNNVETVAVTGSFSGAGQSVLERLLNRFVMPSAYALNINEVAYVIVATPDGDHDVAEVTEGAFSINVPVNTAVGFIFADSGNHFLGYLTLNNGIDALPLGKLEDGITSIDLETLTSNGDVVEPSHNPIGDEIPLTSYEQDAIAQSDSFFASVIKDPDLDGDGQIDILTDVFYRPFIMYFVNGGTFGDSQTPTVSSAADITGYRLGLTVSDMSEPSFPNTVTFSGPEGSGLSGVANDASPNTDSTTATYGSPYISSPLVPPAGTYEIDYNDKTLTFEVPDQSYATSYIALSVPTITVNDDGTMNKIGWEYKLGGGSGSETLDPQTLISQIELQIDGNGDKCGDYPESQGDRIYNSGMQTSATVTHTLTCQNLLWSNVTTIYMSYNDIYGNHMVVTWNK